MAIPITIPRLGWSMEEGIFHGWLKKNGEIVRAGDALFQLESEKATEDIECLESGVLRIAADAPKAGDKVLVGRVIGHLAVAAESTAWDGSPEPSVRKDGSGEPSHKSGSAVSSQPSDQTAHSIPHSKRDRPIASPRARRLAAANGLDLTSFQGTGRTHRIREDDVRRALEQRRHNSDADLITLTNVRRAGVERLLKSRRETVPVTLTTTAVASGLVSLRASLKGISCGADPVPSITDILVKLTAGALVRHPLLAAQWQDGRLVPASALNIGIAVDTPAGLLVPVIRDVPSLSLATLAAKSHDFIMRAGQGKLKTQEMELGVFTLTNLGMFGIDAFTPVINYPECAILGVGRIRRVPACVGENIVAQEQITLSLAFDHRVVDGTRAARFLRDLVQAIEGIDQHEM